jgi:hypothetical protein
MIGFVLYMSGVALFLFGAVTPLLLDSKAGREARRKGVIR